MRLTGKIYKLTALILKRKNIGDGDRIITLFSRESGKMKVIAKGIRKVGSRRASHLELFNETKVVVHKGHHLDSVSEAVAIHQYGEKLHSFSTIAYAYIMAEIVDQLLPDHEKQENIYMLIKESMGRLSVSPETSAKDIVTEFIRKLLIQSGYLPVQADPKEIEEYFSYIEMIIERKLRTKRLLKEI